MTQNKKFDMRDSQNATWKDVVASIFESAGKSMTLSELYSQIDGHKKCQYNPNWQAKVRQTLQINNIFKNVDKGVWALA